MSIRFILLYFVWYSVIIGEEFSQTLLLEHYSLENQSIGIGLSKENQNNQSLFSWIHFGKKISNDWNVDLQISYLNSKTDSLKNPSSNFSQFTSFKQFNQTFSFSPGIEYKFFSFYPSIHFDKNSSFGTAVGLNVFPEKSIFLFAKKNPKQDSLLYALSILSGKNPTIGLVVAKEYYPNQVEWSGSISLSFSFESYHAGGVHFVRKEQEENSIFISKVFRENPKSLLEKEINPLESDSNFDYEREQRKKEWETKTFQKKEKIVYEIKIEELLKYKIPLVTAIRISKASKSKEEYTELLKKLPPNIVRKCNKIQFDKARIHR